MEKELRELQELQRKGGTIWEYWKFLIHSEAHRYALIAHQQELIPALNYWSQMIPLIEQLEVLEDEEALENLVSRLLQMGDFAWEALIAALLHESESIRQSCFSILIQQEIPKTQQIALFSQLLKDPAPRLRLTALNALTEVTEVPSEFLPSLLELLKDSDFLIRKASIVALRNLKSLPPEGIKGLKIALKDSDASVRAEAISALKKFKSVD